MLTDMLSGFKRTHSQRHCVYRVDIIFFAFNVIGRNLETSSENDRGPINEIPVIN